MRYIAAYLLATLGGKETPSAGDVKAILKAGGIECDDAKLNKVLDGASSAPRARGACALEGEREGHGRSPSRRRRSSRS